ncbi:MAG TPA: asparagine synthase (glutamine-hydrolyzing) [Actinobacteria bacterium]|nr:asparagine synthetase [glutamine-hydrolyzing] 1 [bacterium BMS3Bbin01]HDH26692.1 asparagine synthase (glutamine-hydrolyzing) [Actinomycetota bacterium]
MCGIAGAMDVGSDQRSLVEAMAEKITHRGPDDAGYWEEGPISLGHRRLTIVDLSPGGHQPMLSHDGRMAIVHNGEIYNWRDLRRRLEATGIRFRSQSDTEVLLAMYQRFGIAMLDDLEGMFAFALRDITRSTLHLVRDRYGVKPLHYMKRGTGLIFASELRCFDNAGDLGGIDEEALGLYVAANYVAAPHTIWERVRRLGPGCRLEARLGETIGDPVKWFDPVQAAESRQSERPADQMVNLRETLRSAVHTRLQADVPVGVFLSGGIDSGLVSALAVAERPDITTLSVGFSDVPGYDESAMARLTARHLGTDHREITLSASDGIAAVTDVLERLDEPFADSSLIPTYLVSKAARREVKVALSGDGADELFGGYRKYLANRWARTPLVPRASTILARILGFLPEDRASVFLDQVRSVRRFAAGTSGSLVQRHRNMVGLLDWNVGAQLQRNRVENDPLLARLKVELSRTGHWSDEVQRILMADIAYVLPYDMLEKVDRASMWNSLEVRSPFLDSSLLSLAFSFEGSDHVGLLTTKRVLRRLAADLLPREVVTGPKRGFGVPLGEWFRGALTPLLRERLDPLEVDRVGLLNSRVIRTVLDEHLTRRRDRSWELWNMIVLQTWASRGSTGSDGR